MEVLTDEFFRWVETCGDMLKEYELGKITVVHHNDADGICAATILSHLSDSMDHEAKTICIEKVHPAIVKKIHEDREDEIIIYTDLAGLAADTIDKIDNGRNKVFIIDHHPAKAIESKNVFVLDPELSGISGDTFVSASTLAFLVSRTILKEMNRFAYLAVVGSVGDYHDRSGGLLGIDRFALHEAEHDKQVKIAFSGHKERYYVEFFNEYADIVARRLSNLGFVDYENRGYKDAMRVCINGFDERTIERAEKLEEVKREKFQKAIEQLNESGLFKEKYCQWFHLGDSFSPMGVKAVGEFCQVIKDMSFVDEDKYLIGFQNVPDMIPDIGKIELNSVKMSCRAPLTLERRVLDGKMPGFDYLVPKASEMVNAFADATHRIAAATMLKRGKEKEFIEVFEKLVEESINIKSSN